jgi:TRAP-type C4-dicarboxylate transport system substrate-binding protein
MRGCARKKLLLIAATIVGLTVAASAAWAAKWDMPTAYAASNFHTQNVKAFAEAVTMATGGKLTIVVHSGGSLFKGSEIKRAVQTGQVPIGERLLSAHQNENILFGVDSVPFLASSFDASEKLWRISRPIMEKILADQNLVLLYSVPWPPQGLYFNKEITSVADMKGLKFRAYDVATARLAEHAGMRPVQIEEAELVQALATGVAESFFSSGSTGYDRKVWEHLSHFYAVDAWLPRNYVFVNKGAWDKLDEATRNIVRDAAMMAERSGAAKSQQMSDWYIAQLAVNGMQVNRATGQLRSDLESIGAKMTAEWLAKAGTDGRVIIEKFKAIQ